jgi:adenylate cyclase
VKRAADIVVNKKKKQTAKSKEKKSKLKVRTPPKTSSRKLAAIMFTDMVGYTAMAQKNEDLALRLLAEHRRLVRPIFREHHGKEIDSIGDAFLVEFASALDAMKCSLQIQKILKESNFRRDEDKRILLRIGVHLGDIVHKGRKVGGDAVNVASRIEPLAIPGGVCVSEQVYAAVVNKVECSFQSMGNPHLKNVSTPIEVYKVSELGENPKKTIEVTTTQPRNRIAVLPFSNMTPDPSDDYLADGMTEELISTTSKFKEGAGKTIGEIGNELKVGSILEGSIRKSRNSVRVTVQLIDANTDKHFWSRSYDGELTNIFALQVDIAKKVANELQVSILTQEAKRIKKTPTQSSLAYRLYLKGRFLWNKRGLDDTRRAIEYFELAIKEDPRFALGYVGLDDCYLLLNFNWKIDLEKNSQNAKEMVAKAIELDPELAEARATYGFALLHDCKLHEAEAELEKAVQLKPNYSSAHQWYGRALSYQMRWAEAFTHIEKAEELDPVSPIPLYNHATILYFRREYEKALQLAKQAISLNPNLGQLHFGLVWVYGIMKKFEDARREAETAVKMLEVAFPHIRVHMNVTLAWIENDRQRLRALLPDLEAHLEQSFARAFWIACFHFFLGQTDEGFKWLEESYMRREVDILEIAQDQRLDGIRSDPRYYEFLDRLGLSALKNVDYLGVKKQAAP